MILVCGEALIDMVDNGDGARRPAPGGGPFNTARALARLGVPTAFLGRLSDDAFGRLLAARLTDDGVSLALTSFGSEPTTTAFADVDNDGIAEFEFFVEGTSAPNLTLDMIADELPTAVKAIHIGTLGLVLEPMASSLVELVGRESGRRLLMLDPNIRPANVSEPEYRPRLDWLISKSTIVKASGADLTWLYPGLDQVAAADRLLACGPRLILVTLGAAGAYGATRDVRVTVNGPQVRVVDTIGAGDTFGAAALAWLQARDSLRPDLTLAKDEVASLLRFACLAASITCTRAGAEPPWLSEMLETPTM